MGKWITITNIGLKVFLFYFLCIGFNTNGLEATAKKSAATKITEKVKKRFGIDLLNEEGSPWEVMKVPNGLQTGGYQPLIKYVKTIIIKSLSDGKQKKMEEGEAEEFRGLLISFQDECYRKGIQTGDRTTREIDEVIKAAKGEIKLAKNGYDLIFLATAQLGRDLYNTKVLLFKGIWDELNGNPLEINFKEKGLFYGESDVRKKLTDVVKEFFDLDPNREYVAKAIPEGKLQQLGLCNLNGDAKLRENRTKFEKKFYFLAANLLPLLSTHTQVQQMENSIYLVISCLKMIEDSEDKTSEKGAFEKQMKDLCFECFAFQWYKVFDEKTKKLRTPYQKEYPLNNMADERILSIDKAILIQSVLLLMEYMASFLFHMREDSSDGMFPTQSRTGKEEWMKKLDQFIYYDKDGRLIEIARLLVLLQDFKINNGQRLKDTWDKIGVEIHNLCSDYRRISLLQPPPKKTPPPKPVISFVSHLLFILQEAAGYGKLLLFQKFNENGFPRRSGLSNISSNAINAFIENINVFRKISWKSELTNFEKEIYLVFSKEEDMPFRKTSIDSETINNLFVKDVYDENTNKNAKKIIGNLVQLMDNLMDSHLSLIKIIKSTNYFRNLNDMIQYMRYFSHVFTMINDNTSSSFKKQSKGICDELEVACETLGYKIVEEKETINGIKITIKKLNVKESKEVHPFEKTLKDAVKVLEETKKLLKGGSADVNLSEQEKRNEIFYIECDLAYSKSILAYWNHLKEGMVLLWKLFARRSDLEKAMIEKEKNKCEILKNKFRQTFGEIVRFLEDACQSLGQVFTENTENIQNIQISYWMNNPISLNLNNRVCERFPELKKIMEQAQKDLEKAKKTKGAEKESEMKQCFQDLIGRLAEASKSNSNILKCPRMNFADQNDLFFLARDNAQRKIAQETVKKVADSIPIWKEIQSVVAPGRSPFPSTKRAIFIPLRSDFNDVM
ncbi:MAG: hypothetical protein LBQ03_00535 [Puniceicoccales bacterium]|jgi:hypothetical protein|nr:hypothetical protein [Puniceicoccales bacterium]